MRKNVLADRLLPFFVHIWELTSLEPGSGFPRSPRRKEGHTGPSLRSPHSRLPWFPQLTDTDPAVRLRSFYTGHSAFDIHSETHGQNIASFSLMLNVTANNKRQTLKTEAVTKQTLSGPFWHVSRLETDARASKKKRPRFLELFCSYFTGKQISARQVSHLFLTLTAEKVRASRVWASLMIAFHDASDCCLQLSWQTEKRTGITQLPVSEGLWPTDGKQQNVIPPCRFNKTTCCHSKLVKHSF